MTNWWTASRRRRTKGPQWLSAPLRVELLEQRTLLAGLVLVPSPQVNGGQLNGAAAISASDIWAVGGQNPGTGVAPLAEHFDGTSWRVVSTPSPTRNSALDGVAAAASNDVWAVGVGGTNNATLIEHWNGTNWSEVPSPTMPTLSRLIAVTAPATNNAWAIGTNSQSNNALVEHWDGTSWSVVSSPAFTGVTITSVNGGNISADSTTDVWVVGAQGNTQVGAPFNGGVSLHWNGQTWSLISGPAHSQAVTALSPTNVWGAGFRGTSFNDRTIDIAVVEHWDGTSWSIFPSPNPNKNNPQEGSSLAGIAAISANDIWAVGGGTLTEHWNGMSWKVVSSPNPGFLAGVTALSDGTVAAVGSLILQNAASAPKTWSPTAAQAAPVTTADSALTPALASAILIANSNGSAALAASATTPGTTTAAQTPTMPLPLDAAQVDKFFATVGKADQPLSLAGHSSGTHAAAAIWDLTLLPQDIWSFDRN